MVRVDLTWGATDCWLNALISWPGCLQICIFDVCFSFFFFTSCCRETLLGQLTVYVKGIRDDFISKTQNSYSGGKDGGGPPQGRNMPEIVNNIVWVRQLDSKVGKPSLCP